MQNTIIYLFGFPGRGKYTIAREIEAQTGARVIDNHLINNPIFSLVRKDGKTKIPAKTWGYTLQIMEIVLDAVVNLTNKEQSFIFTNFLLRATPKVQMFLKR
jgi:predicted kinase